ncbi:spinocerebellar ataxia type 10 protein domain-containing protein [Abortiporus biennis]|nr:spinocerebellar ataxia type 10 protein domain-containing protein [Abortiporus biennis]
MAQNARFCDVCARLDLAVPATVVALTDVLDDLSKAFARDHELREQVGKQEPVVWEHLEELWNLTAYAHSRDTGDGNVLLSNLCLSTAKFTRNLVAAVPHNQQQAFTSEPAIRTLIRYYTAYSITQDENSLPITRMLIQALSNLITSNPQLSSQLWSEYLKFSVEEFVLLRLLGVPDTPTVTATFVFILNCIHSNPQQIELLVRSKSGQRLCISLLDQIAQLFDVEEEESERSRAFHLGYTIFTHILEAGLIPELYQSISMDGEIVTPHQTILLKLVDSYLHTTRGEGMSRSDSINICKMLLSLFDLMAEYCQTSIQRSVGNKAEQDPHSIAKETTSSNNESRVHEDAVCLKELDLLLPKVCEAMVLVVQSLTSLVLLHAEDPSNSLANQEMTLVQNYVCHAGFPEGKGEGLVECLIDTLRLLDIFLPRIAFGKVAPPPIVAGEKPNPAQYVPQSTPANDTSTQRSDPKGFLYLKRDLVRLLGTISYKSRLIQDRVRACHGLQVILNLCVIDERNPYLREHAIFALRNLLNGNAENQTLVNDIQPIREWDERGELQR